MEDVKKEMQQKAKECIERNKKLYEWYIEKSKNTNNENKKKEFKKASERVKEQIIGMYQILQSIELFS